ncbi:MAG TPA: right-handed parallel beta-helix repeat-containing protein [Roseiflexaceae bacterium]|nr:right-handed parallel beta-helix repeat-containing protein [Roseiflexaceae bacterium]
MTTADDLETPCVVPGFGFCSLRAAIKAGNAGAGADTIGFNIAGSGPHVITPAYPLPVISDAVTIDGYTQPGSAANTQPGGTSATIQIVIDGSALAYGDGLTNTAAGTTIRGLLIRNFPGNGIHSTAGVTVVGNRISNNTAAGILLDNATGAVVGSITPADTNQITNNGGAGVAIIGAAATQNQVRGNAIDHNGGLGIDLGNDGVTANDAGDADSGPNGLQNFPSVNANEVLTVTTFSGTLESLPNTSYAIDFYAGAACDPSGNGEGARYVASATLTTDGSGSANYSLPVTIVLPGGSWITAVATGPHGSSEFSACAPLLSNESWVNAYPVPLTATGTANQSNGAVAQLITRDDQSRWYRFPITPGSFVRVELESRPGFNMTLHSDLQQEYDELADPAGAAEHALNEQTTGYLPKGFLATEFLPADYLPKGFLPKGFLPKGFLPKGFLPKGFLESSVLPKGFLPKGFLPAGYEEERYSGAIRRTLLAIADDPDATLQVIERNTWDLTGNLYVRVSGPTSMLDQFNVNILVQAGFCETLPQVPAGLPVIAGAQPASGSRTTLILWDSARMPTSDPTGNMGTLAARLAAFAAQPAINGTVIDLATLEAGSPKYPRVAFANASADATPTCSQAKNIVADEITAVVNAHRQANTTAGGATSLQYIVLIGNDNEIPFKRYLDVGGLAYESDYYPPVFDQGSSEAALRQNMVLGQDVYGASSQIWRGNYYLPIADLAVGRLVGRAADVIGLLNAYDAAGGVVNPSSALVTGYDFVSDAALATRNELALGLSGSACPTCIVRDSLIQPEGETPATGWSADDLREELFGNRNDMIFFSGHFDAGGLLAADYTTAVSADEVRDAQLDFTNAIFFSLGCHAGYNIPPDEAVEFFTPQPDWAQAFAERGATFIGATGYAYGDTEFIEYGERLLVDFTRELRSGSGAVPLGNALRDAKLAYLANKGDLGGTDDKTLIEFALYGLPMFAVNLPGERIATPVADSIIDGGVAAGSLPGSAYSLQIGQSGGNQDITLTPSLTPVDETLTDLTTNTPIVTRYYRGRDGVVVNPLEPIMPLEVYDVTLPGQVLRGVGFRGGSYTDVSGITPFTGAPASELSTGNIGFITDVAYPVKFWGSNLFAAISGGRTRLMITPAQYLSENLVSNSGSMRLYNSLTFRTFYVNENWPNGPANLTTAAVAAAPDIVRVTSTQLTGGNIALRVRVVGDESAGIQQVWITYTDPAAPFPRTWQSIDLQRSLSEPEFWETPAGGVAIPASAVFMVQAANGTGLVTLDTNGGSYYPVVTPPAAAPTDVALELLAAPSNGIYARELTVSARLRTVGGAAPVAGQYVALSIGNQRQYGVTNAAGEVIFTRSLDVRPGAYRVQVIFPGSESPSVSYGRAEARFNLTVAKETSAITVLSSLPLSVPEGDSINLALRLVDPFGRPIADRSIFFVATGTAGTFGKTAKTSNEGRAVLGRVPWPAGSYSVNAYFAAVVPTPNGSITTSDTYYQGAIAGPLALTITPKSPPVTTISISGLQHPLCPSDCYSGSATVTLSVDQPTATTFYRLNGGALQTYSGPFVVATEGSNTLEFYSVSAGGIVEATQSVTIKVTHAPVNAVLDAFNRANGKLGSPWSGSTATDQYRISGQRVLVDKGGLLQWGQTFDATQEAFMRLTTITANGRHHSLALKVNGSTGGNGAILVSYDAVAQQIVIDALLPGKGWRTVGTFAAVLQNGDLLGARANANGTVDVYVNCVRIGSGDTRSVTGNTYVNKGGRIGVWFFDNSGATFDDFGGGNVTP